MTPGLCKALAFAAAVVALGAVLGPANGRGDKNGLTINETACPRTIDPVARRIGADCFFAVVIGHKGPATIEVEDDRVACVEAVRVLHVPPLAESVEIATLGEHVVTERSGDPAPASRSPGGLAIHTRNGRVVVLTLEFDPEMPLGAERTGIDVLRIRFRDPAKVRTSFPCHVAAT